MLRYLPVQSGHWIIGIPLAAVVEVRTFGNVPELTGAEESRPSLTAGVPALTLSAILGDLVQSVPAKYGILMTSHSGVFGLLVEELALPQSAAALDPLPVLVASPLFTHIVAHNNSPVLLLNVETIGQIIHQSAG